MKLLGTYITSDEIAIVCILETENLFTTCYETNATFSLKILLD